MNMSLRKQTTLLTSLEGILETYSLIYTLPTIQHIMQFLNTHTKNYKMALVEWFKSVFHNHEIEKCVILMIFHVSHLRVITREGEKYLSSRQGWIYACITPWSLETKVGHSSANNVSLLTTCHVHDNNIFRQISNFVISLFSICYNTGCAKLRKQTNKYIHLILRCQFWVSRFENSNIT